jgi:spore germination protein
MMGVSASESEKALRGSREGFCDALKANTALLRKRVRNHKLKVNERIMGSLTKTTVALVYVDSLARPAILDEINKRLDKLEGSIEFLTDSGIIEQLTEESEYSPFPQYQTTERPDRAAMALMEGRIILFVDNSPTALILPTSYNSFFKTADDYFLRYHVASLARIIRYIAAFLAVTLPGIYVAAMTYHPEIIPEKLLLTLYDARATVPFSVVIEVLIMELSFELLREAGIRVPGPTGNTIGIVGGLIIGQSAVSAGIVSPIIVVIVALTALSSFAIPSEELAGTFRVLKYLMIISGYILGLFGLIAGWLLILTHLSRMSSFGFPYLTPGVSRDIFINPKDSLIRFPMKFIKWKSLFRKSQQ